MHTDYVLPVELHNRIVEAAFRQRGFTSEEAADGARICQLAAWHGIKSHNALKALHLDAELGSGHPVRPGCVPGAECERLAGPFPAAQRWNAHRKFGPSVAFAAMAECERMADMYGVGIVSVDHAFHYLWGGGYVMESARRGYLAYTNCTSGKSEVVPFRGKHPTIGTNPHSWGFPTRSVVGFPIVIDWATSTIAFGKVQQQLRDGGTLPADAAVDADGHPTQDPHRVAALLPFGGAAGGHKGYGLALVNELIAAFIGGSLPTLRSRPEDGPGDEKSTPNFFFQVIHPDALNCHAFAGGRDQTANVKAIIADVLGHGNDRCMLPGQIEHEAAQRSQRAGGLLFTELEIDEFKQVAEACGVDFEIASLQAVS